MLRIMMSVVWEVSLLHPFRILSLKRRSHCFVWYGCPEMLQIKCLHLLFVQGVGRKGLHTFKILSPSVWL